MTTLRLTAGDTPTLTGTANADLTGASAEIHIQRPDQTVVTHAVALTDAATGAWSVDLVAGDLTIAGTYRVELKVTYSDARTQTFTADPDTGIDAQFEVRLPFAA